jgi:hypothetical protein
MGSFTLRSYFTSQDNIKSMLERGSVMSYETEEEEANSPRRQEIGIKDQRRLYGMSIRLFCTIWMDWKPL